MSLAPTRREDDGTNDLQRPLIGHRGLDDDAARRHSVDYGELPSTPRSRLVQQLDAAHNGRRSRRFSLFASLERQLASRLTASVRIRVFGAFLLTVILELGNYVVLATTASLSQEENGCSIGTIVACAVIMLAQIIVIGITLHHLVMRSWVVKLRDAWMLYVATTLVFTGFYSLFWAIDHRAITHNVEIDKYDSSSTSVLASQMIVVLFYFSVTTQTLTGFGDISPVSAPMQITAIIQQLVGIVFHVAIISQTMPQFQKIKSRKHGLFHSLSERLPTCVTNLRRGLRRYLLITCLFWEGLNYAVIAVLNDHLTQSEALSTTDKKLILGSCAFQALQLVAILAVSMKFVRKANDVTSWFLVQSYLSVVLLFGGLYATLFLSSHDRDSSFYLNDRFYTHVYSNGTMADVGGMEDDNHPGEKLMLQLWPMVFEFIYFSVCVFTATGYGDVFPKNWYARLVVCLQMFIGVMMTIVILGFGLSHLQNNQREKAMIEEHERARKESLYRAGSAVMVEADDEDARSDVMEYLQAFRTAPPPRHKAHRKQSAARRIPKRGPSTASTGPHSTGSVRRGMSAASKRSKKAGSSIKRSQTYSHSHSEVLHGASPSPWNVGVGESALGSVSGSVAGSVAGSEHGSDSGTEAGSEVPESKV